MLLSHINSICRIVILQKIYSQFLMRMSILGSPENVCLYARCPCPVVVSKILNPFWPNSHRISVLYIHKQRCFNKIFKTNPYFGQTPSSPPLTSLNLFTNKHIKTDPTIFIVCVSKIVFTIIGSTMINQLLILTFNNNPIYNKHFNIF